MAVALHNVLFPKNLICKIPTLVHTVNYSIVKDSNADLGVVVSIVQKWPTIMAVCTKISKEFAMLNI